MSGKSFCLAALVAAVLGLGSVRGQGTNYVVPSTPPGVAGPPTAAPATGQLTLSRWLLYDRQPGCCGPTGGGPIGFEVYVRSGIAFPVEGGGLGGALDNGWMIEGGVRTLFFNAAADAAWTVDFGFGNTYNRVAERTRLFQLFNVGPNQLFTDPVTGAVLGNRNPLVSGSDLNRTFFNASLGKEWYLWGSAEHDNTSTNWRVGVDVGGRYGTDKLDLNETRHLTDTTAGMFASVHSDVEIPWGTCLFQAGLRVEYGYTFSDILQRQNDADTQDINVLLSFGLRY